MGKMIRAQLNQQKIKICHPQPPAAAITRRARLSASIIRTNLKPPTCKLTDNPTTIHNRIDIHHWREHPNTHNLRYS